MVIAIEVRTPAGPQRRARNPRTLFRVRFSWASLFRWYALKNARVPPAIVLSRLAAWQKRPNSKPLLFKEGNFAFQRSRQVSNLQSRGHTPRLPLALSAPI